jgi:8-oxo-dGTP pyrophosphatase MutT (NUDIX family)
MNNYPLRKSIKVLLLNNKKELLLIHVDDPKTTSLDGTYQGPFWCLIGGGIKPEESVQEAALREIYEETGMTKEDVTLGPVVWHASFDFIRTGTPTHMEEQFIVAKTMNHKIEPAQLSDIEKSVIKKFKWFSLDEIKSCKEPIYPTALAQYLPDILAENYPEKPIKID